MEYRNLGKSGLKVSRFSLGTTRIFPETPTPDSQPLANKLIKAAFDSGINFFDTAETYSKGQAERCLGQALLNLQVPRSDYVIYTKIFWGRFPENTNGVNNNGTSVKHLKEGLNRSLKNLQTDYVDLVLCHRYDQDTPTREVVQTMKHLIAENKTLYWGTSAWPVERVMEAILLCDILGCPRPICEQCEYSMIIREPVEKEYVSLFDDYGIGTMTWSPLKKGILTGKYNNGIPKGSRFDVHADVKRREYKAGGIFSDENREATIEMLKKLGAVAERIGCSMAQLALAWVIKCEDVSNCILGASSVEQLEENLGALEVAGRLDATVLEEIEGILGNRPQRPGNMRTFKPVPFRR